MPRTYRESYERPLSRINSNMQEENPTVKNIDKTYIKISRTKRRIFKHVWLVRGVLLGVLVLSIYLVSLVVSGAISRTKIADGGTALKTFAFPSGVNVKNTSGRTNILVLGRGGEGHEAPNITDTLIFTSLSHENGDVSLVSIPRDIWIPEIRAKINSAYYWGEEKEEGGGLILAKSSVEEVVGEPVHYAAVVDFTVFREVVDILGGVEVDVERPFVDTRYPIPGKESDECGGDSEFRCRYETVEFEEGVQTMDGERALKFVRSRNAQGDEGTDIARATRQQKIITAIKDKILSAGTLFSPKKISALIKVLEEAVETDADMSVGAVLARRFLGGGRSVSSYVLGEEFLVNPPQTARYDNLYVFVPKDDTWKNVHDWVDSILP